LVASTIPQRFVCGGGNHVRVRNRILVAGEDLPGDQTGEVRHVDHQGGPDLVGDLPHRREVDPPRISRVPGNQNQWLELAGGGGDGVVVQQAGLRVGAVAALMEHLAGDIGPEAVGEVAAGIQ
jgi:hypothetical protein